MPKGIGYVDAVRLLGRKSKLTKILTGVLVNATPLSLLDLKDEVDDLAQGLVGRLRDRVTGLGRHDRTARLEAAHAVVILAAFFQALDALAPPFATRELRLTRAEQLRLAGAPPEAPFVAALADIRPAAIRAHERDLAALTPTPASSRSASTTSSIGGWPAQRRRAPR